MSREVVLKALGVSPESGLTDDEVRKRSGLYGKNMLRKAKPKSPWIILLNQFKSLIALLLVAAAALSFALGDLPEGIAILIVLLIISAIGFFTEIKAVRSMEALHKLVLMSARVRRGSRTLEVPSQELVNALNVGSF